MAVTQVSLQVFRRTGSSLTADPLALPEEQEARPMVRQEAEDSVHPEARAEVRPMAHQEVEDTAPQEAAEEDPHQVHPA